MRRSRLTVLLVAPLFPLLVPAPSIGAVLCTKRSGVLVLRDACKRKEAAVSLSQLGVVGPPGADGALRIYGNGSAGARVIDGAAIAASPRLLDDNLQYTDLTVEAGVTLEVGSGTVIRCTGTFTNRGTIRVARFAEGGDASLVALESSRLFLANLAAHPGVSRSAAMSGQCCSSPTTGGGGSGGPSGRPIDPSTVASILRPGPAGGGGGGGTAHPPGGAGRGGSGGGTLVILARGGIINAPGAEIVADGEEAQSPGIGGGGGGAGGIVILASPTSVDNQGLLAARGAPGTDGNGVFAPGGGGGGGIIRLISPAASSSRTLDVGGGPAGTFVAAQTGPHASGGGGGSCAGQGGFGGSSGQNTLGPADPGGQGAALITRADPTALF